MKISLFALALLITAGLAGCSEERNSDEAPDPTAEVDTTDTAPELDSSTSEIPTIDFAYSCAAYRLFSFSSWWSNAGLGNAYAINDHQVAVGRWRIPIPKSHNFEDWAAFEMPHFDRLSDAAREELHWKSSLEKSEPTDPVLYDLQAIDINNQGTILGHGVFEESYLRHAAVWQDDNVLRLITTDIEERESRPQSLNDSGTIVGYYHESFTDTDAAIPVQVELSTGFVWQDDGSPPVLMSPPSGAPADARVEPYGVNNDGQICGGAQDTNNAWQPFIWDNGAYIPLETLDGGEGIARAISNTGLVVGESLNADGVWTPVLWNQGGIVDLGLLETAPMESGTARGVNDDGVVIGWDDPVDFNSYRRAWVWQDGTKADLTATIDSNTDHLVYEVHEINASGVIVGSAVATNGMWGYGEDLEHAVGPYAVALIPQDCGPESN